MFLFTTDAKSFIRLLWRVEVWKRQNDSFLNLSIWFSRRLNQTRLCQAWRTAEPIFRHRASPYDKHRFDGQLCLYTVIIKHRPYFTWSFLLLCIQTSFNRIMVFPTRGKIEKKKMKFPTNAVYCKIPVWNVGCSFWLKIFWCENVYMLINQFEYLKIQPKTMVLRPNRTLIQRHA